MEDRNWQEWLKEAWAFREETLYTTLFGSLGPGVYPLHMDLFSTFHQESIDPRWLSHGVFECPPNGDRPSWLYVSSGLSNAWEAESPRPEAVSGLGCEFILECPQQSRWALLLVRRMVAFQLLLSVKRFPGKPLFGAWDRIPLRFPIDGSASALTWVLLAPAPNFGGHRQLPSGHFQFLEFVGITEDEADWARSNGSDRLFNLLLAQKAAPVTDPNRSTILSSGSAGRQ